LIIGGGDGKKAQAAAGARLFACLRRFRSSLRGKKDFIGPALHKRNGEEQQQHEVQRVEAQKSCLRKFRKYRVSFLFLPTFVK
jgi:hypothetical protein